MTALIHSRTHSLCRKGQMMFWVGVELANQMKVQGSPSHLSSPCWWLQPSSTPTSTTEHSIQLKLTPDWLSHLLCSKVTDEMGLRNHHYMMTLSRNDVGEKREGLQETATDRLVKMYWACQAWNMYQQPFHTNITSCLLKCWKPGGRNEVPFIVQILILGKTLYCFSVFTSIKWAQ